MLIGDRFVLQQQLGSGGYGEVWLARLSTDSSQQFALKFLHPLSDTSEERFSVEMRALALLKTNTYIVQLHAYGRHNGRAYLAMEHVEGVSLDEWLRGRERPPELTCVFSLFQEICAALSAAHRIPSPLGPITHRDLKPSNIMIHTDSDGEFHAKVLDFGVARVGPRRHTRTGDQLGTLGYMPPEQAVGDCNRLSPASDVFALGILLIEMLTKNNRGPDNTPLASYVVQEAPNAPHFLYPLRKDVPKAVWDVIARAVRPCVTERIKTADQLWSAIFCALHSSTIEHATVLREVVTMRSVPVLVEPPQVRSRWPFNLLLACLDGLVLGGICIWLGAPAMVAVALVLLARLAPLLGVRLQRKGDPLERALSSAHRKEVDQDRARIERCLVAWCCDFSEESAYALCDAYGELPLGETVLSARKVRLLLAPGRTLSRETRVQRIARILCRPKRVDSGRELRAAVLPPREDTQVCFELPTAARCGASR
jgi:hypothetical protein